MITDSVSGNVTGPDDIVTCATSQIAIGGTEAVAIPVGCLTEYNGEWDKVTWSGTGVSTELTQQTDGNFVLYAGNGKTWGAATTFADNFEGPGCLAQFQWRCQPCRPQLRQRGDLGFRHAHLPQRGPRLPGGRQPRHLPVHVRHGAAGPPKPAEISRTAGVVASARRRYPQWHGRRVTRSRRRSFSFPVPDGLLHGVGPEQVIHGVPLLARDLDQAPARQGVEHPAREFRRRAGPRWRSRAAQGQGPGAGRPAGRRGRRRRPAAGRTRRTRRGYRRPGRTCR